MNDNETQHTSNIKLYFNNTCGACPEQYDVYSSIEAFQKNVDPIGYVRLRWGHLYCDVPHGGETVFEHTFTDDSYKGSFDDEAEKDHFLTLIEKSIIEYLN
jgi:hypothetical protein